MAESVYTVGHSTHSIERFFELLREHAVDAIADVRSTPFSKFNPQFSRGALQKSLRDSAIKYVFLGKELGARSDDPNCYSHNKVQYDRLARTELFQSGIDRVMEGAGKHRIALMCAERDPLHCHRTILVARELVKRGVEVKHILPNGAIESHSDSIERLKVELKLPTHDFFRSDEELEARSYALQAEKIAYDKGGRQSETVEADTDMSSYGVTR